MTVFVKATNTEPAEIVPDNTSANNNGTGSPQSTAKDEKVICHTYL